MTEPFVERWNVCKDGEPINQTPFETQNEAFAFLLRWQGQSVDYAITHGGYTIESTILNQLDES